MPPSPFSALPPLINTRRCTSMHFEENQLSRGYVWEWTKDRKDNSALTAGSSWWYSSSNTTKSGAQFKAADFYAIYVGFRCAFEK